MVAEPRDNPLGFCKLYVSLMGQSSIRAEGGERGLYFLFSGITVRTHLTINQGKKFAKSRTATGIFTMIKAALALLFIGIDKIWKTFY